MDIYYGKAGSSGYRLLQRPRPFPRVRCLHSPSERELPMRLRACIAIPALSAALALVGLAVPGAAQASTAAPATQLRPPPTATINSVQVACYRPSQYVVIAS